MTESKRSTPSQDESIRRAVLVGQSLVVSTFLFIALAAYLAFTTGAWQSFSFIFLGVVLEVLIFIGIASARRGQLKTAGWFFLGMNLLGGIAGAVLYASLGYLAAFYILVTAFFVIRYVLPREERRLAIVIMGISLVICISMEVINPAWRQLSQLVLTLTPTFTVILGIAFIAIIVREAWNGNIRAKLSTSFVILAIVSVLAMAYPANQFFVTFLTDSFGNNLNQLASARSVDIGRTIDSELKALTVLALNEVLQDAAAAASRGSPLSQADMERLDQQWRAADLADSNADPLVAGVLNNQTAAELREFRDQFPKQVELFLTGVQGVSIASTNRTSDYLQSDEEWWQTAYQDGLYVGQPEYDESSKTIAMNMAVAVRQNGKIVGILRSTVNFNALTDPLVAGLFGETGRTSIYLPDGSELGLSAAGDGSYYLVLQEAPPDFQTLATSTQKYQTIMIDGVPTVASTAGVTMPGNTGTYAEIINQLNWRVVTLQDQAEARQPLNAQTRNTTILALVIIVVGAFAGRYQANAISNPIIHLSQVAQKITAGDLSARAEIETTDEVGDLANTLNAMTSQLQSTLQDLEKRVAERTRALTASTEVSRRLSTILDPKQLVKEVVDQVQDAFDYYHVHIYLKEEASGDLIMAGGTGEAGAAMLARGHKIPKGRGLVGRTAETNAPVLVPDTSKDINWLPNPLLPDTKSEAAVPISISNEVMGVLDVQQNIVDGLKEDNVVLLQSIANQVAIAVRNARSYEESRSQAELETMVNTIGQKIQRAGTVEDVLQTAIREVGLALGASRVSATLQPVRPAMESHSLVGGNGADPKR